MDLVAGPPGVAMLVVLVSVLLPPTDAQRRIRRRQDKDQIGCGRIGNLSEPASLGDVLGAAAVPERSGTL